MTPEQFDEALRELGWKGSDFCARVGLVPNTVWRWRKGIVPFPQWVGEYLRAVLAIQRLHSEFVSAATAKRTSKAVDVSESDPEH